MNVNKINICNMALALMGADIISEMDEPSKEAKACKVFYENTKNKLLARYDWSFASKTVNLQKLKSEHNAKNRFKLPADTLTPREITSGAAHYEIEGNVLITGLEKVTLRYTAAIDDAGLFSPHFIDALAYALASDMTVFLTDGIESAGIFTAAAEKKLEDAAIALALFTARIENNEALLPLIK